MSDFVFRLIRSAPFESAPPDQFFLVSGPVALLTHGQALVRHHGIDYARQLAKSFSSKRTFYIVKQNNVVINFGTLTLGVCRYYPVEPTAVVIGSCWTADAHRGRGLATSAIRAAMNCMISKGSSLFYIDTQANNTAMLRSIEKLGFGNPIKRSTK